MATRKTVPNPTQWITLEELRVRTGIIAPTMAVVLARFGYDKEIGTNGLGDVAVPVETASAFLGDYEAAKTHRAGKVEAYKRHRRELEAAERQARAEAQAKAQADQAARIEKAQADRRAAAQQRIAEEQARLAEGRPPSFSEWEAEHDDE